MESTPALGAPSVAPACVIAAFATVPDPRRAASVVSPLPAILALAVAAILANHLSVLAIAQCGARQNAAVLATLGFSAGRTPCQSRLQRLFRQLDGDALSARLSAWFAPIAAPPAGAAPLGVAIDGKAQRGRLRFAAVSLLRRARVKRVASRLRAHAQHPEQAVALVVAPLPAGA
jgi:hypothetical protein